MLLLPKFIRLRIMRNETNNFKVVNEKYDGDYVYVIALYDPACNKRLLVQRGEWDAFIKEDELKKKYQQSTEKDMMDF